MKGISDEEMKGNLRHDQKNVRVRGIKWLRQFRIVNAVQISQDCLVWVK